MEVVNEYQQCLNSLKKNIDWDTHAISVCAQAQDETMNKPSNRFDKSHVLSFHLELVSHNYMNYVDEAGWDFEMPQKVEDKTSENILMTPYKKKLKSTIRVMLTNTMGNSKQTKEEYRTNLQFKLLLLRQTSKEVGYQWVAALDPLKLVDSDIQFTKDQVCLEFSSSKLDFIYKPDNDKIKYLRQIYEIYSMQPMEQFSSFKDTMIRMFVEEKQYKIKKVMSSLDTGVNIGTDYKHKNSGLQGQQKNAA